jgi:hypothetical protein
MVQELKVDPQQYQLGAPPNFSAKVGAIQTLAGAQQKAVGTVLLAEETVVRAETAMVQSGGQLALKETYRTVVNQPGLSQQSLPEFLTAAESAIEQTVANAPKRHQSLVRQSLKHDAADYYADLKSAVQKKEIARGIEALNFSLTEQAELMTDRVTQGQDISTLKESIESTLAGLAALGQSPTEIAKLKKGLQEKALIAHYSGEYARASEEGKGIQFMQALNTQGRKDLSPTDFELVSTELLKQQSQRAALDSQAQAFLWQDGSNRIQSNQLLSLTDIDAYLDNKGTPLTRARLEGELIAHQGKKQQTAADLTGAQDNARSPAWFVSKTPSELNALLQADVDATFGPEGGATLSHYAELAQRYDATFPELNKKVNNSILYGAPDVSMAAMELYTRTGEGNKAMWAALSDEAVAMAQHYNTQRVGGYEPAEAWKLATGAVTNLTPKAMEERKLQFKELTEAKGSPYYLGTTQRATEVLVDALSADGVKAKDLVPGMVSVFESNLKDQFRIDGDMDKAIERTANAMRRNFGWTDINGYRQYAYLPFERFVGQAPGAETEARNMLYTKAVESFAKMKADFDNPNTGVDSWIEVVSEKDIPAVLKERAMKRGQPVEESDTIDPLYRGGRFGLTGGGAIKVRRHWRTGEVQEGYLNVSADRITENSPAEAPSYYVALALKDGGLVPLPDPMKGYTNMRFDLDLREIQKRFAKEYRGSFEAWREKNIDAFEGRETDQQPKTAFKGRPFGGFPSGHR